MRRTLALLSLCLLGMRVEASYLRWQVNRPDIYAASLERTASAAPIAADAPDPVVPSQVWHGTQTAAPEPAGGLLLALGFGMLALRRRVQ